MMVCAFIWNNSTIFLRKKTITSIGHMHSINFYVVLISCRKNVLMDKHNQLPNNGIGKAVIQILLIIHYVHCPYFAIFYFALNRLHATFQCQQEAHMHPSSNSILREYNSQKIHTFKLASGYLYHNIELLFVMYLYYKKCLMFVSGSTLAIL